MTDPRGSGESSQAPGRRAPARHSASTQTTSTQTTPAYPAATPWPAFAPGSGGWRAERRDAGTPAAATPGPETTAKPSGAPLTGAPDTTGPGRRPAPSHRRYRSADAADPPARSYRTETPPLPAPAGPLPEPVAGDSPPLSTPTGSLPVAAPDDPLPLPTLAPDEPVLPEPDRAERVSVPEAATNPARRRAAPPSGAPATGDTRSATPTAKSADVTPAHAAPPPLTRDDAFPLWPTVNAPNPVEAERSGSGGDRSGDDRSDRSDRSGGSGSGGTAGDPAVTEVRTPPRAGTRGSRAQAGGSPAGTAQAGTTGADPAQAGTVAGTVAGTTKASTKAGTKAATTANATEADAARTADSPTGGGVDDPGPDGQSPATAPWPTPKLRFQRSASRTRRLKPPRRPAVGLPALFLLAMMAGFVSWVSADPFWLAAGHGRGGTATVTECSAESLGERCRASFTSYDGSLTARKVSLVAAGEDARRVGATVPAAMVSAKGRIAYAGPPEGLYLRWALGLGLVVLCGFGIAWATGAYRLVQRRHRIGALATSVVAPLLLFAGMLAATW